MIYTSYFANLKNIQNRGITPVSISKGIPNGIKILSYKKLAPPWSLIQAYKQHRDIHAYTKIYLDTILNKLNQFQVISQLLLLTNSSDIALICFEKPGDFCHRQLVANWLNAVLPEKEKARELKGL